MAEPANIFKIIESIIQRARAEEQSTDMSFSGKPQHEDNIQFELST